MSRHGLLAWLLLLIPISGPPARSEAPAAKPGKAAAEFKTTLGQLRKVLGELGILQSEYRRADDSRRAEIKKRWQLLIKEGDVLQPKVIDAAERAFAEAPNADKEVTELLMELLIGNVGTDNYEEAARLGKLLLENKCDDQRAYNLAGLAAAATADFDAAEKYLALAVKNRLKIGTGERSLDGFAYEFLQEPAKFKEAWAKEQKIRAAEAKAGDLPRVLLKTNKGDIEVELFENEAPNTVASFVSLVEKGYYDGLTFHRVLPAFMAQGGCPDGTGRGGPGYNIPCECYRPDYRRHFRASLSMAKSGAGGSDGRGRDTGGSQFFITFLPTSFLDGKHTAFGRVVDGFDVLHKIRRRDPEEPDPPEPDKIVEAKVLKKRDHAYVPRKVGD